MYTISFTSQFKKDYKKILKRNYELAHLDEVLHILISGNDLPSSYNNHPLKGKYKNSFDCHIRPDWILIYKKDTQEKSIILVRTGTHSDLF
jgi:mRNA interferase YafQ